MWQRRCQCRCRHDGLLKALMHNERGGGGKRDGWIPQSGPHSSSLVAIEPRFGFRRFLPRPRRGSLFIFHHLSPYIRGKGASSSRWIITSIPPLIDSYIDRCIVTCFSYWWVIYQTVFMCFLSPFDKFSFDHRYRLLARLQIAYDAISAADTAGCRCIGVDLVK